MTPLDLPGGSWVPSRLSTDLMNSKEELASMSLCQPSLAIGIIQAASDFARCPGPIPGIRLKWRKGGAQTSVQKVLGSLSGPFVQAG